MALSHHCLSSATVQSALFLFSRGVSLFDPVSEARVSLDGVANPMPGPDVVAA